MARLRAPGGCPWDREQSFESIQRYTVEETYEVVDAIERKDYAGLCEELGDLILQPVFHAQIAAEAGLFDINDSLTAINEKLIRRHPHIFGTGNAETAEDVKTNWDRIKAEEKGDTKAGLLDSVNRAQPALMEAMEISKKAAKSGFEWEKFADVVAKMREELSEFEEAQATGTIEDVEGELGDLLFTIVNLARWTKVDAEQALRRTNAKFRKRFAHVEQRAAEQNQPLNALPIEQLESYWHEAKKT